MSTEFGISVVAEETGVSLAKYVCVGIKAIVVAYKKSGIVSKAELTMLQDEYDKRVAEREANNEAELTTITMQKVIDFTRRFDVNSMSEVEKKMFYAKLEKMNDNLDKIVENYSKGRKYGNNA